MLKKIESSDLIGKGVLGQEDTPGLSVESMQLAVEGIPREVIIPKFNAMIDALKSTTDSDSGADNVGATAITGRDGITVQEILEAISTALTAHEESNENPHSVTAAQVGLGNCDNTADADKPVSTAQQAALNLKVNTEEGKALSTNDYTNVDKLKLSGMETGAQVNVIESVKVNGTALPVTNKAVDVPVPKKTSDILNDSDFITNANVLTKDNNTAYTPTGQYHPCTKGYADSLAFGAGAVASVFGRVGAITAQVGDYTADKITMTGYEKPDVGSAVAATDDTGTAIGKAEAKADAAAQAAAAAQTTANTAISDAATAKTAADNAAAAAATAQTTANGKAPTSHTHAASQVTAGTLGGQVQANVSAQATLGNAQVRSIYAGTSAMTAGSTELTTGHIYLQYE